MVNSGNTHPVSIVDKNGKHTVVHKRVTPQVSSAFSRLSPPSVAPYPGTRSAHEKVIMDAVAKVNDEAGYHYVSEAVIAISLGESSDVEIGLIAGAMHLNGFKEMLMHAEVSPDELASIAVVYDPEIKISAGTPGMRIAAYSAAINMAHKYMRGPIGPLWDLYKESEEKQDKAKRYVAVHMAVNMGGMDTASHDIMDLALNANEDDYSTILTILRSDNKATLERINFVLEGGSSAISAGAI